MVLMMDTWGAHVHGLWPAAVKVLCIPFGAGVTWNKGHPKPKAIQAAYLRGRWGRKEGGRLISSSALPIVFMSSQVTQHTVAGAVKHECIRKGQSLVAVCCAMCALRCLRRKGHSYGLHSISIGLQSTPSLDYPGLWGRERLNEFVWSLCLSWWHVKKNPVKIKLSSSLLKNDIVTVQCRLK